MTGGVFGLRYNRVYMIYSAAGLLVPRAHAHSSMSMIVLRRYGCPKNVLQFVIDSTRPDPSTAFTEH